MLLWEEAVPDPECDLVIEKVVPPLPVFEPVVAADPDFESVSDFVSVFEFVGVGDGFVEPVAAAVGAAHEVSRVIS